MPVVFHVFRRSWSANTAVACPGAGHPGVPNSSTRHPRIAPSKRLRRGTLPPPGSGSAAAGSALVLLTALLLANPALALDANRASASELQTLNGIGPKTAALIVKERARGGPYESLDNLAERVKGIGAKKARRLQSAGLRAGGQGAAPDRTPAEARAVAPSSGQQKPAGSAPKATASDPKRAPPATTPAPRRPIHSPVRRPWGL